MPLNEVGTLADEGTIAHEKTTKTQKRINYKTTKRNSMQKRTTAKMPSNYVHPHCTKEKKDKEAITTSIQRGDARCSRQFPWHNSSRQCGSEEIVISKAYAEKLNLRKENTNNTNLSAKLWARTLVPMERCCKNLIIQIGEATITVSPYVVQWIAYDLILGRAWLSEANLLIDCKMIRMLLKQQERIITLDTLAHKHGKARLTYMLTSKNFVTLAKMQKSTKYIMSY